MHKNKFANKISLCICRFKSFFYSKYKKNLYIYIYSNCSWIYYIKIGKDFVNCFRVFSGIKFKYGLISFPGKQVVCLELVTT